MKHVLVDGSVYRFAPSGGAFVYLNELFKHFPTHPDLEIELVTPSGTELPKNFAAPSASVSTGPVPTLSWFPNGKIKELLRPIKRGIERLFWRKRAKGQATIYHSVWYYPFPDTKIPSIVMVHDLISEKFPELYPTQMHSQMNQSKHESINKATHFIAVSECTKKDLVEMYGVDPKKVDVVYHGVDHQVFFPLQNRTTAAPYFLYVGGRLNHKNFERFAIAFGESETFSTHRVICAGFPWSAEEKEFLKKNGLTEKISLIESPTTEKLRDLYQNAEAFVFPSLYEGFGIPLIEAMACGTPVLCSNTGPMPEIAQKAALYFDPLSVSEIRTALEKSTQPQYQKALRKAGLERARAFDWQKTSEGTLQVYRKVLAQS